jgi:hypothetical protein
MPSTSIPVSNCVEDDVVGNFLVDSKVKCVVISQRLYEFGNFNDIFSPVVNRYGQFRFMFLNGRGRS